MSNKKYNGWANWETWVINLWLSDYLIDLAEGAEDAEALAESFEESVNELLEVPDKNLLLKEIVGGFMNSVDWKELAEHAIEDNK